VRLELVTAPAAEPVTLQEAKDHARITTSADDSLVSAFVSAARHAAEAFMGRAIVTQVWRMWLDAWPMARSDEWWDGVRDGAVSQFDSSEVRLPWGPIGAGGVAHVKTYDDSDAASTFSSASYYVDQPGARIRLRSGATWPTPGRTADGIEIQWEAGFGNAAAVPEPVKTGIKAHVASLYEHRGDEKLDLGVPSVSELLYQRYRVVTL
jgi:hypothetical protein